MARHIDFAKSLQNLSEKELTEKKIEKSSSVIECTEYLNRYTIFYNPKIKLRIEKSITKSSKEFNSGF